MTRLALRAKLLSFAILGAIVTAAPGVAAGDLSGLTARCNWRQVLSVPGGLFSDVAVARGSVWAVGYQTPRGSNKTYPLVSEWNGRRWSTTVGKGFGKHWGALAGVSGDLWVTGVRNRKPVLHHFAGQRWTTEFRDVTFGESQGSDAIWMREGSELVRIGRQGQETRLELPPSVKPDAFGDRTPFAADARGRVWVDDGSGSVSRAHFWDGSRWSASRYPDGVWLHFAMATRSPNDVWAVGNELSHWNGRRWTKVVPQGESQVLYDIDLLADKVLTVGQDWSRLNTHGVIVEWDGKRWHTSYHGRRSVSNRGCPACDISTVESFEGVTFASGREAWAVGFGDAGNDTRGVIFRGTCT